VEFRRSSYPSKARFVVIYATAPLSRVVGWFEVGGIDRAAPSTLWGRYRAIAGIDADAFDRYYEACHVGAAITVRNATRIDPVHLTSLDEALTPPQSYRYLDEKAAARVGLPAA
jgi:predicted transcriptional regulator